MPKARTRALIVTLHRHDETPFNPTLTVFELEQFWAYRENGILPNIRTAWYVTCATHDAAKGLVVEHLLGEPVKGVHMMSRNEFANVRSP